MKIKQLEILESIGQGSFGIVYKVREKGEQQTYALKRVIKVGDQMPREFEVLQKVKKHHNCIYLKNFFFTRNKQGILCENFLFQYCEKDLQEIIDKNKKFDTKTIKLIVYQILNGLDHLHKQKIIHRDIKPENILIDDQNGTLKICDFGCSIFKKINQKNTPQVVSRYYRAPELCLGMTSYNSKIDIWSVGCLLLELILGKCPFNGDSDGDQIISIVRKLGFFGKKCTDYFEHKIPALRGSSLKKLQILKQDDSFFQKIQNECKDKNLTDFLSKILCYIPKERQSAKQLLNHPFLEQGKKEFLKIKKNKNYKFNY